MEYGETCVIKRGTKLMLIFSVKSWAMENLVKNCVNVPLKLSIVSPTEPVAYHNSYFGAGYGPILYSNVSCGGWETSFAMCSKNEYLSFSCSRGHTAGLLCGERMITIIILMHLLSYTIECNDGDIRLVGGSTNLEGTVEICFGNLWGLISESGWGDHDAAATCRQLGFLGEGIQ